VTAIASERKTPAMQHPLCMENGRTIRDYTTDETLTMYAGTLAAEILSSGECEPMTTATGRMGLGRVKQTKKWSAAELAAGKTRPNNVRIEAGVFCWGANGETWTAADRYQIAYGVDNQTVSKVATGKSPAGIVFDVKGGLPWVLSHPSLAPMLASPGDAPLVAPQVLQATLVAGTVTVATGFDLRATSIIVPVRRTAGGTTGNDYIVTARTSGAAGTASITIQAQTAGVLVNTDTSVIDIIIFG
jgi:hypothetical protein